MFDTKTGTLPSVLEVSDASELIDPAPKRRKLWEIDSRYHCSIVGTCLTLRDLHRLARKLRIAVDPGTEDYTVHGHFVGLAGKPGPVTKAMHKALDRKYVAAIRRFGAHDDDASLEELWNEAVDKGDIPGPYWALFTHPSASAALTRRAYGEVHMLSHLVGSSNRADIRRIKELETDREAINDELSNARRRTAEKEAATRRMAERHTNEIDALKRELAASMGEVDRLRGVEERLRLFEEEATYVLLRRNIEELEGDLSDALARADGATSREEELQDKLRSLTQSNEKLREDLDVRTQECRALETIVRSTLCERDEDRCPLLNLGGRCIVYVGGRAGLVPHLRAVVERSNGILVHHDGGIENNEARLITLLARGDAVLCPIDCVSHIACQTAKRLCKQRGKAFVPLRSSGLSSFVNGLKEIVSAETHLPRENRA